MEFRWLHLIAKFGGEWLDPILQSRTSVDVEWKDVPFVPMTKKEYEEESKKARR